MEKVTVKKETIIAVLNYLQEKPFKEVAALIISLEQEVVPQLQIKTEKVDK